MSNDITHKIFYVLARMGLFSFGAVGARLSLVFCVVIRSSTGGFLLLRYLSVDVWYHRDLQVSQYVVSDESSFPVHHSISRNLFVFCVD